MKRWGFVITVFYALVVVFLLFPLGWHFLGEEYGYGEILDDLFDASDFVEGAWLVWVLIAMIVATQAALLFLSVDTSRKRLKPRRQVAVSVAAASFAFGLLSFMVLANIIVAFTDDDIFDWEWFWYAVPAGIWVIWGAVFYAYRQRVWSRLDRVMSWILKGSVLELLVAVPTHILVRQRGDCSAPLVSGYGIATGIALMLMAFGPSVLFLFQKRLADYQEVSETKLYSQWPIRTIAAMLMLTALALFFFLPTNEPETERGSMSLAESELPALVGALESVAEDLGLEFQPPRPAPGFSVPTAWIVNCGAIQVARFQTRQQRWSYVLRGERFASESDYEHFAQRIHEAHDPYGEVSKTEQHLLESIGTLRFRLFSGGAFRGGCQLERSLP